MLSTPSYKLNQLIFTVEPRYNEVPEIKHVFLAFIAWWKSRRTFGRIREQISETQWKAVDLLENSHKLCRGFQQAMGARKTCFISFIKLLFSLLTKRKTMYEARTVKSQNSEQSTTLLTPFLCFIAPWKHTCRPIETHELFKFYFIKQHEMEPLSLFKVIRYITVCLKIVLLQF